MSELENTDASMLLTLIKRQIQWGNRAINGKHFSPAEHLAHFFTQLAVVALFFGGAIVALRWIVS